MTLDRVTDLAERARTADDETAKLRAELHEAMREARHDHTLQEIGDAAGVTRKRVHQILGTLNRQETQP
jgi:hypothetical protein